MFHSTPRGRNVMYDQPINTANQAQKAVLYSCCLCSITRTTGRGGAPVCHLCQPFLCTIKVTPFPAQNAMNFKVKVRIVSEV